MKHKNLFKPIYLSVLVLFLSKTIFGYAQTDNQLSLAPLSPLPQLSQESQLSASNNGVAEAMSNKSILNKSIGIGNLNLSNSKKIFKKSTIVPMQVAQVSPVSSEKTVKTVETGIPTPLVNKMLPTVPTTVPNVPTFEREAPLAPTPIDINSLPEPLNPAVPEVQMPVPPPPELENIQTPEPMIETPEVNENQSVS